MNLQGPFQLPSLSFCDHIRPLRLGSLSAAEHSLHWGVGKQGEQGAQARGSCRVPQGSQEQSPASCRVPQAARLSRSRGSGARGPSSVASSQKAETGSGGLGAPLPLAPHFPSLHCRVSRVQLVAPVQSPALRTAESAFVCSHVSSGSVAWNTSQSPRVWGGHRCNIELGLFFAALALWA